MILFDFAPAAGNCRCRPLGAILAQNLKDPGAGFSLEELRHAAINSPADSLISHVPVREAKGLRPGGFGLLLAKNLVDELIYNEKGNDVLLIKYLHQAASQVAETAYRVLIQPYSSNTTFAKIGFATHLRGFKIDAKVMLYCCATHLLGLLRCFSSSQASNRRTKNRYKDRFGER